MTIIDAWNAAKVGQEIRKGRGTTLIKRESDNHGSHSLVDVLVFDTGTPDSRMFDFHVLASDWEVVKIPHKYELTMREVRRQSGYQLILTYIPNAAKVTIEWED